MKSVGIIAEYNPFHNGHLYHINKVKEMFKDYNIVLVLGGNFTQRGDASLIDKWHKTSIALNYVDLVIELPFTFATQSSDIFASGAIQILNTLKCDYVVFGSELNDIKKLTEISKIQENDEYNELVKKYLDEGENYPSSMSKALQRLNSITINNPNDLLAISYIKEINRLKSNIKPISIKRTDDYHKSITSATGIRNLLKKNKEVDKLVPKITLYNLNQLHYIDDYFNLLKYKILTEKDLKKYVDVDEGIDIRIKKYIIESNTLEELVEKIKTKRFTYNKIKRTLLHILCCFEKKDNIIKTIKYIRVLGFNENGKNYLNSIKKDINIPIITNYKKEYEELLRYEIISTSIYDTSLIEYEYKSKPIIK